MKPLNAITLSFLILASLLTFTPSASAITFSPPVTTSQITTGGLEPSSSTSGETILVAHKISSSGIIAADVSSNGGTTWATKSTGLTGVTNPHALAVSTSVLFIFGSGEGTTNNAVVYAKSTDSGSSWTTGTAFGAGTANTVSNQRISVALSGSRIFVATQVVGGFCTSTGTGSGVCAGHNFVSGTCAVSVSYSDNNAATWTTTTAKTSSCGNSSTGCSVGGNTYANYGSFGLTVQPTSTTAWRVTYTTGHFNGGSSTDCVWVFNNDDTLEEATTTNTGSTYTTASINDVFSPLSAPFGSRITYAKGSTDLLTFTDRVTPGKIWAAERQSDGWHITQFTGTANLATQPKALLCGSNQIIVFTPASGGDQAVLYHNLAGQSWSALTAVTGSLNGGNDYRLTLSQTNGKLHVFLGSGTGATAIRDAIESTLCVTGNTAGILGSTTVTGLNGFDADPFNQVIISRTSEGSTTSEKINTYNAADSGLALRGASPLTNACATNPTPQQDGVMAYSTSANGAQYSGYTNCNGSNIVNDFSIRGGDLNSPDQSGANCIALDGCNTDVSGQSNSDCPDYHLPDGSLQIGNIAAIPIDWSSGSSSTPAHTQFGFAYSNTANGNIGTWTFRQEIVAGVTLHHSCTQEVAFSSPGNTYQICSWRNTLDGNDYIAAVGPSNPTKAWRFNLDAYTLTTNVHTTLTPIAAGLTAPYDHIRSIACVDNDAIVVQNGGDLVSRIHIVGGGIGGVVWGPISTGSVVQRGAAVSRDGKWAAIVGSTGIMVLNATTGDQVGNTITMPAGTFKEIRLSSAGQVLWIATSSTITEYDVHSLTTGVSVAEGSSGTGSNQVCRDGANNIIPCSGSTTTSSSTATGAFFGLNPAGLDPSGQGNAVSGGFFLSLLIIIGFAATGAGIIPTKNPGGMIWGAGLGALLGFAWTVFLGTMPAVITFILIVIGISIIGFKIKVSTGEAA